MYASLLYNRIVSLPEPEKIKLLDYLQNLLKNRKKTKKANPQAGCMKGTFVMKDGVDEPFSG